MLDEPRSSLAGFDVFVVCMSRNSTRAHHDGGRWRFTLLAPVSAKPPVTPKGVAREPVAPLRLTLVPRLFQLL
jgi:hypothetical protein